jgi:tetratricopeptide (TPR) repeat protein/tRNA A-37 threonylcarbamoyl transferase component Bud32
MSHDQDLIRRLVADMIESGQTVEQVCGDHPGLVTQVRLMWQRARAVENQIEALFPYSDIRDRAGVADTSDLELPRIPGYEVQSIVGYGGMGVVYKARHLSLNRTVAIKVPLAGAFATAAERQRHVREAQAVAALAHPNIITVHDVGDVDGRPYFTMEFVDGGNLSARVANTPQPVREAASLVATLAEATDRAHQAGIIHRDLKPANILIASDGTPKITDFGLARRSVGDATLSVAGLQFGTPSYMSPEQASGDTAAQSPSVDIYSLGAILYEMLTGRPPFRAESSAETLRQVLQEQPVPPSRLNPKVPRDLETVCLACLRKEPHRRYPNAAALADDLRRFLRGEPIRARPVPPAEQLYQWARRRPAYAAVIGACIFVTIATLGVAFWMQHIQNARAAEATLREGRAREAIETAVSLADELRTRQRWIEARHVLDNARSRVPEANSHELAESLDRSAQFLADASELDDIRRRYPDCSDEGYDYGPAAEAYRRVFTRMGLGADVPVETAAHAVNSSPIRKELLIALDSAAFVVRVNKDRGAIDRYLAVASMADPDPWRDRFRQTAAWFDRDALLLLSEDARSGAEAPPPHQVVLVGVLLGGLGSNDKALDILRDAHRLNPLDFWVNLELGNALDRAGRTAEASQYFRAAVTIQPTNPGPWVSLGVNLNRSGLREEAAIAARRATELNPHIVVAWRNYISYLRGLGRIDEAETALNRAIEQNQGERDALNDLWIKVHQDLARQFASRGQWDRALHSYRSLLPKAPDDGEFWFEVAAVSVIAGEPRDYERIRDSMLERHTSKSFRPFLVARAVTLTPVPNELVNAVAAVMERESPRDSQTYWAMTEQGAVLCRSGRPAEAIPFFERSIASDPSAGRAILNWLWLAIANHQLGRTEESARWHATAVAWLDALDGRMPDNAAALGFHLHNWLEAQVLRRESDLLLRPSDDGR